MSRTKLAFERFAMFNDNDDDMDKYIEQMKRDEYEYFNKNKTLCSEE